MSALLTRLNVHSEEFKAVAAAMRLLVDDLDAELDKIALGNDEDARKKYLSRGSLLDPSTPLLEIAPLAALSMCPEKGG